MKELTRPRAILFDWDDTLVDNWQSIHAAMNATLSALGRPAWPLERTLAEARRSLRNSFPEIFGSQWGEARDIFYREFAANHLQHLKPKPGAGETLAHLAGSGFYLGVVSNKTGEFLRREAEHLDWARHFRAIVGAADAARDKPDPAPLDLALAEAGIPRGPLVWYVGDGEVDMEFAHRAGCIAVLLRDRGPGAREFQEHPPARHVPGFAALETLVFSA